MRTEDLIFTNLVNNEPFTRKVLPFIKAEYFNEMTDRILFGLITDHVNKYNIIPNRTILQVELQKIDTLQEEQYNGLTEQISGLTETHSDQQEWLLTEAETFCKDKAMYNAIMQSIKIMDDKSKDISKGAIPQIVTDALAISFDSSIGHDFVENSDDRYDYYHAKHKRIPFDLDYMNRITKGGLMKKTLTIALAGTGVGKTLFMCHCAANNLLMGFNVLYITMEVSELEIAKRIDANTMGATMDDLEIMPKLFFDKKIAAIKGNTSGRLIVKEYPTGSASAANFRFLLNELKLKKKFKPDIIYIDYLNICSSARVKGGNNVNSYTMIKSIAEELRGLAVEFDVPIMSATQTTRAGFTSSDPGLEDTSESFGVPATADLMFALVSSDQLAELNQILVKQLKNRYNDPAKYRTFVIGVDRPRMKLYDVDESAQEDLTDGPLDTGPIMDNTEVGQRIENDETPRKKRNRKTKLDISKFKDFK